MVFEEQVAYYLDKYLGKFVKGLSKEALKISVWAGNVELTNMQLKPEALNALKLPIKVKAGFLGSVKLKIPWSRLGQEPVVVLLDRIYLLAEPATNVDGGDSGDAVQEAKMKRVTEAERKLVEAQGEASMKQEVQSNSSWLGSLISTIIGNLKLSISNIHVRYEDLESNPGHPFSAGLTLEKLAAVTVDENGKETFVTGGSLDRIQKLVDLQRLAIYFDPDSEPWKVDKKWEDLRPNEWTKVFVPGIKSEDSEAGKLTHSYVLQPVGGNARYYKLANKDQRSPDSPAQKAIVMLDDVTVGLSEGQYRDALKLVENFSTFNKRLQYAHYRPSVPINEDKRAWWQYAIKAVSDQQKKASGHVSWNRVVKLSELRKKYLSLYVSSLQSGQPDRISVDDNSEIKAMDRDLDTDVIIQWRLMAHSYVDSTRAKDQKKKQQQQNSGWWPFGWGGAEPEPAAKFTDEDLEKFNQLIGYQEGQESNILPGHEPPNMLHTLLDVRMRHNASKLVSHDKEDLLELSCEDLQCVLHMYPKTMRFDLKLGSYQVACPEGLLAESATKTEAVNATFTYLPSEMDLDSSGEKLDWSLAAKASPCYAKVLMRSINKIIKFFQSSKAVSRSVALDTATALQTTLDEVTRNAQQQINQALKDRPRFSIDLDLAAPKITIPTGFYPDGEHQCNLLVDLGYFSLQTVPDDQAMESKEEIKLYMRFRMKLTDVSAILVDGEHDWTKDYDDVAGYLVERKKELQRDTYLPVLDKCAMLVAFQQICVPHPQYPTTRVALRVPSLAFHLSPARYHRLMEVLKVFNTGEADEDDEVRPWEPSDFEGDASVLAWKGVGHREAVWQHRHVVLTGPFLYILDSPNAQSYKYCSSLIGKQVSVVPPESVGDIPYVLAVCDAGQFNNKVAESVNALLLRFEDETTLNRWQGRIIGAIYRASGPAAIASLVGGKNEEDDAKAAVVAASEGSPLDSSEQEKVLLIGVLDELKIIISNSQLEDYTSKQILLEPERLLLEFRAIGTKVEFVMKTYDMSVGAVLQALEVEDKCNGHVSESCKYLARSYIKTSTKPHNPRMNGNASHSGSGRHRRQRPSPVPHGKRITREGLSSDSDRFFDATEDLDSEGSSPGHKLRQSSHSLSNFFDAEAVAVDEPPTFVRTNGLLPIINPSSKDHQLVQPEELGNFVKVQVIMCSQDSPDYANVDKQVTVTLATLSFFSNRRTLLALLDLVTAITADVGTEDPNPAPSSTEADAIVSSINPKAIDDREQGQQSNASYERHDSVVKGLLGRGKSRTVFLVVLNMDRAQIVLNLEDGNQLSVLTLADLNTEVKVFPASFGLKVALGNLQVTDGSLDESHTYHYICNMRDPDGASFIELEFLSFNKEDDDYEGFDYSIMGKLSEVRIVFLNRFVQEIVSYFMGLVPTNSGYVVKLKDRVTNVEKFFDQSEIEGQPAMKLGLSLNKPVIIMPRSTSSKDFLELDILHVNLYNNHQWLGGGKDELKSVHLETTTLELEDLHLVVGVNGQTGEGIIQEARGLALVVRRPIRDLWHQLPAAEASIKIEQLRAALSDKEYQVITECAVSNMAEAPNLPPPVIESDSDDNEEDQPEVETIVHEPPGSSSPSQNGENESSQDDAWTTVKVAVGINMVELGLFTGQSRESALAAIQVTGVWASYKSNTLQESNIQATLEKFSVRDDREGTEAEMRYMIGNADDGEPNSIEKKAQDVKAMEKSEKGIQKDASSSQPDIKSALTMLVMDAKIAPSMQVVSLRIQRPRLLVAFDFLLAVAEFFIPSIHTMLSDGKGNENPLDIQNALFLKEKVFTQNSNEVVLSPKRPLVADADGIDTFVYDGKAAYIRLLDRKGADLRDFSKEVIILVGDGKKLIFKNVVIQNGDFLDSCISLGNNSSYSALKEDGVYLEGQPEKQNDSVSQSNIESNVEGQDENQSNDQAENKPATELIFDLQAVSPELTFYDSMSKTGESMLVPERLLRMRMNIFSRFVMKGDDMELNAQINGFAVEASSGIQVVEPVDMVVKYTKVNGKQNLNLVSTEIYTNFSFSIVQLILRLQADVMSFLRITSEQITVECSEFDKVWSDNLADGANCITFWRARAPPGFAVLGDCMTPREELPSKGVIALNMNMARVKRPLELVLLWSSSEVKTSTEEFSDDDDDDDGDDEQLCCVWLPVPPPGYVALGCVASTGRRRPPLNTCLCVLGSLVSPCGMKDCIIISGPEIPEQSEPTRWSFWRVDNSTGSFFMEGATEHPQKYRPRELRHVLSNYESFPVQETKPQKVRPSTVRQQSALHGEPSGINPFSGLSSGRFYENVARFNLVWWDKNSGSKRGVSIWRPVVPSGCVILGDVAVRGYEPPSIGLVLHDAVDRGLLSKPERFLERGQLPRKRGMGGVSFWFPLAPPGYVAFGCVATVGSSPDLDIIRCVRSDLVIGSNFEHSSLWDTSDVKHRVEDLSIWHVDNQAISFMVQRGLKHPPKRLALSIADLKRNNAPDNLVIEAEVKQISATAFDDFGGLMAPLVDISISEVALSLHGRVEEFSSKVNFSLEAATFNGKNSSWEPLIESWDGGVRFEYISDPSDPSRPTESRLRLTANSPVNINVSTANINLLLEAYASWNRLNRMEENSKKQLSSDSRGRTHSKSALNVKSRRTMHCVTHNELGEELFLRILDLHQPKILSLPSRGTIEVRLPAAHRMQDAGTKSKRRKKPTKIVSLRIGDAEVAKDEGIGGREYLVAVRIVPRTQRSHERQLQYQSARTRCVSPEDDPLSETVIIHWDEVFIFEVEPQEGNSAEITVTDVGRGINVGYCHVELLEDEYNSSKLTTDKRIGGLIPSRLLNLQWESLYKASESSEGKEADTKTLCGKVSIAKYFFSLVGDPFSQLDGAGHERATIQVGPTGEGPWNPVGLNYALGPAPWYLNDDVIASEFYVEGGVKHLVMRSLVSVQNGTDFDLEVSLAMISMLRKSTGTQQSGESDDIGETFEEDFFENERYQPIVGWGNNWPGHLLPTDPAPFTASDFSNPLKEFPDVKLPLGWEWKTNWHVEKVSGGDQDGWGYGFDFRTMHWPPKSESEKSHSFVRRRRWVRVRESIAKSGSRVFLGVVEPGSDLPLPLACLRPTSANYSLQIRPTSDTFGLPYEWSQVMPFKGIREGKKQQSSRDIKVMSLTETEELLCCTVESSSSTTHNKDLWFCLEATSSTIGKDAELDPIEEWKVMITPSIMLKNYLPIPCEFSVSEKSTHNRLVVRDRGVIKPGAGVGIFHIDLRKGIYLTWLPQGGWNPKKETVLISHPYREPVDHITFTNTRSSRSLRVMIDQDRDEKGVAAKVLVFYVPCWLDSDKCPPLQYRLVEILQRGDTKLVTSTDEDDIAKAPYDGVKVGNVIEQVNFEEKDEYPTMLSDMNLKTTGLSVAINRGNTEFQFGSVSPLAPLESLDGFLELRGLAESGLVFRFLVSTAACPLGFAKTKVIRIRPFILFTNRVGEVLYLKQKTFDDSRALLPSDWRVSFPYVARDEPRLLQIKLEGYEWSSPFALEKETTITIPLHKTNGFRRFIKVDIRGYEEGSRFSVMFRLGSTRGPYRLENRTADVLINFRQKGSTDDDSWQQLKPHATKTFAWEDTEGEEVLEVLPADGDPSEIIQYEIDKIGDHSELSYGSELAKNISVRVIELLEIKTVRFYCKVVELEDISEDEEIESSGPQESGPQEAGSQEAGPQEGGLDLARVEQQPEMAASGMIELVVNIGKLGVSITDQHPRELLYLSLDNIMTSYDIGFGERLSRLKVRIGYLQLDNQLPLSWMPVLLAPESIDENKEFLMKISLHAYDDKTETTQVYPYVGLQVESGFRINVHEPIIWAVVNMLNNVHLDRLSEDSDVVQVDPEIRIDLIDISEVRLKLTLETAAGARPRGMLGVWSPLVTTLGNTNKMPIRLGTVFRRQRYMRKSAVTTAIINRIRRDLIHQPLQLLSGVNVLGMTSSTLGTLSQGAAELSKDGKYLRVRLEKDRNRNVAGVGDGLLKGTEALARGIGYGVSGVVTKPITNARQDGVVGFFQGVGKAALGFFMLPVSGVLDFVSLTVSGVGVTCISCLELFEHEPSFTRRRLPRAIKGNSIIFPYNPQESEGQAILQLAQSRSIYGFKGAFTDAAKFAYSDFYEAHFELPRSKVLMLTNRRILMLGRPKSHFKHPEKTFEDPSNILWEITWRNLLAVESHQSAAHGPCLLLHLRRSSKTFARTVKCQFGNAEAGVSHSHQVAKSLQRLWKEYGPDRRTLASETSRRKKQSGRLSLSRRLKEIKSSEDGDDQERMINSSNSGKSVQSGSLTMDIVLFEQIWSSEQESVNLCCTPSKQTSSGDICTIWRPHAPDGYVSVGDIARIGSDAPPVAVTYRNDDDGSFAPPLSYSLVWRNWKDGFCIPISIWMPKAPEGYVAVGCVAVADYIEPDINATWCVREDLTEVTTLGEKEIWRAPSHSPWNCFIYPVASECLSFFATREQKSDSSRTHRKVKLSN